MILVRKRLDLESQPSRAQYLTLNLFCNWAAHIEITQSMAGLRILGRINDGLVKSKIASGDEVQTEMSRVVGFDTLYAEFLLFLQNFDLIHEFSDRRVWAVFLGHLIEIVRDVPLTFPPISSLKKGARKIYDRIVHNPIKPGAGVISMKLSMVDYDKLGAKGFGEQLCIVVRTEDNITIIVPLKIELLV